MYIYSICLASNLTRMVLVDMVVDIWEYSTRSLGCKSYMVQFKQTNFKYKL